MAFVFFNILIPDVGTVFGEQVIYPNYPLVGASQDPNLLPKNTHSRRRQDLSLMIIIIDYTIGSQDFMIDN